jgi:hypothetical protein
MCHGSALLSNTVRIWSLAGDVLGERREGDGRQGCGICRSDTMDDEMGLGDYVT